MKKLKCHMKTLIFLVIQMFFAMNMKILMVIMK